MAGAANDDRPATLGWLLPELRPDLCGPGGAPDKEEVVLATCPEDDHGRKVAQLVDEPVEAEPVVAAEVVDNKPIRAPVGWKRLDQAHDCRDVVLDEPADAVPAAAAPAGERCQPNQR